MVLVVCKEKCSRGLYVKAVSPTCLNDKEFIPHTSNALSYSVPLSYLTISDALSYLTGEYC